MIERKIQKTFIRQQGVSDCGVACLASIVGYYEGNIALETLRELSGTSTAGTTLMGLYQAANKIGFDAEGLQAELIENLRDLNGPAILHVLKDGRIPHYVVFYGFADNNLIIGDPGKGITLYSTDQLNAIWFEKSLLSLTPNERFACKTSQRTAKAKLGYELIKDDFIILAIALAIGIIVAILELSTAIFSQKLIDEILPANNTNKLYLGLLLVLVLLLCRSGLSYLRGLFVIHQGREFNNRIVQKFYGTLIRLPKYFFDTRKTGELIARLNDTGRIQMTLSLLTSNLLISTLVLMTSTILIFIYSWIIGCTILALIPLYGLLIFKFRNSIIEGQKNVMVNYAISEGHYIDTIQGISTIKVTNREEYFKSLNAEIYNKFQDKIFDLGKINNVVILLADIIGVIFLAVILGLGSFLILDKQFKIGELVAVITIAANIVPSISQLIVLNVKIQEAKIAFDRMFDFLSIDEESKNEQDSIAFERMDNLSILITDLTFRFTGREPILQGISLEVKHGELVVLMGESGGGKSTLLQILQKFYNYESGSIKVNGIPLNEISIPQWRSRIGIIPQDVKIFNGSLLYNITLNNNEQDYLTAIKCCIEYGLNKFFEALPQGYNTLIGEEGINLSGGQKQLVAFARVIFKQPKFLLLDEATSAMDRKTEEVILAMLHKLKKKMAIIFVSHRPDIVKEANRVYVLQNGKSIFLFQD